MIFFLVGGVICAACTGNIIAKVDGDVITSDDVQQALRISASNYDPVELTDPARAKALKTRVMDHLIEQHLIAHTAAARGVNVTPEEISDYVREHKGAYSDTSFAQMLDEKKIDRDTWEHGLAEQLLTQKLIDAHILPSIKITDAELRKYYQAHAKEFMRGESVHVRQILLDSEARAKELHTQITKGGNVAQLATEHSISPEAADGGDLGWIERGQFPQTMEEACFKLPTGAVSDVIHTEFGYHIFKVLERRGGAPLSFESVKEDLKTRVQQERVQQAFAKLLDEARAQSKIVVKEDALARIPITKP